MEILIKKAKYIDEYKLQLLFSNDSKRTIDFKNFLSNAINPMTKKYLDLKRFKKYKILYGDLVWGDYELCFPIWDLYKGKI